MVTPEQRPSSAQKLFTTADLGNREPLTPTQEVRVYKILAKRPDIKTHHRGKERGRPRFFDADNFSKLAEAFDPDRSPLRLPDGTVIPVQRKEGKSLEARLLELLVKANEGEIPPLSVEKIADILYPGCPDKKRAWANALAVIGRLNEKLGTTPFEIRTEKIYSLRKKGLLSPATKTPAVSLPKNPPKQDSIRSVATPHKETQPPFQGEPMQKRQLRRPETNRKTTLWRSPFSPAGANSRHLLSRERPLEEKRKIFIIDVALTVLSHLNNGNLRHLEKNVENLLSAQLPNKINLATIISGEVKSYSQDDINAFLINSLAEVLDNSANLNLTYTSRKEETLIELCKDVMSKSSKESLLEKIREHFKISTSSPGPQSPEGLSHS